MRKKLCQYYCIFVLHLLIPCYGLAIICFQVYPSWRLDRVHDTNPSKPKYGSDEF